MCLFSCRREGGALYLTRHRRKSQQVGFTCIGAGVLAPRGGNGACRLPIGRDAGRRNSPARLAILLSDLSHLGIPLPITATRRGRRGRHLHGQNSRCPWRLSRSGSRKPSAIGLPWIGATTAFHAT